jgi:hypothetical protein
MRYLLFTVLIIALLVTAGCTGGNQKPAATPSPVPTTVRATSVVTTTIPTIITPPPTTVPPRERQVTDGFWCRYTTVNIGKAPTDVTECLRFFPDMTYQWGYSPGSPMGKSPSCSGSPGAKCVYSVNAKGQFQLEGGYSYTLSGDALIDPHDPPYFLYSPTGIP